MPGSDNLTFTRTPDTGSPRSDLLASQTRLAGAEPEIDLRRRPTPEPPVVVPEPVEHDDPVRPMVGRVAVITGGGGPVGRAVALSLVDAGARVCVLGRDVAELRETTSLAGADAPILYLQCDLGSLADVEAAADFIARWDRPVDVLVHAAEVRVEQGVVDGDVADLDEQYLVNLRGPYLLTQQLVPQLRESPGHVVFLDPAASGRAGDVQFAMSKAGLDALASGLREELGESGVRVSIVRLDESQRTIEPLDVADCVLGAIEMPRRLELSELHVRGTEFE